MPGLAQVSAAGLACGRPSVNIRSCQGLRPLPSTPWAPPQAFTRSPLLPGAPSRVTSQGSEPGPGKGRSPGESLGAWAPVCHVWFCSANPRPRGAPASIPTLPQAAPCPPASQPRGGVAPSKGSISGGGLLSGPPCVGASRSDTASLGGRKGVLVQAQAGTHVTLSTSLCPEATCRSVNSDLEPGTRVPAGHAATLRPEQLGH